MSAAPKATLMASEVAEIPAAIRRCLADEGGAIASAAQHLRQHSPHMISTIARGSSDHVATFLSYAIQLGAGVPVSSLAPSIVSIFGAEIRLAGAAALAISQSGGSPDLVAATQAAKRGGAETYVITNNVNSPLVAAADRAIDISAGPEKSVAATKSFVNSVVAGLALLAQWQQDEKLSAALAQLPIEAEKALACDWSALSGPLNNVDNFYVLGRGPAFAIAHEAALKFKETCGLHAEAYSAAEVMHGPLALVENKFPILVLSARDAAQDATKSAAKRLVDEGANVFITGEGVAGATNLPFVATGHPLTDALCLIMPFYRFVESHARARGLNPDVPPRLKKVTETK